MHIAFLSPEYVTPKTPEGGLANYLRNVGRALVKRGQQVSVFVVSNRDASWQDGQIAVREIRRISLPKWVKIHQLRKVFVQILSSRRLAAHLWKIHGETPFDIIHASSYLAPGYALLSNGRVPVVSRISSYSPLWRSAHGRKRNLAEFVSDWLEIRQVLDAEASFAPSHFMARTFARLEGHQPQVIRTPLDTAEISLDQSLYHNNLAGKPYLLFFGTLNRIKGADLLAEVIPSVFDQYKELSFVFVGRDDGLPDGRQIFPYICSHCGPHRNRLHYHSVVPKEQLYPIVANALGVVMPSRVDNYPNACLEAQSFGTPVIGTYDSSLDEMILDGETGFLARNGEPTSLCFAVNRLLKMTSDDRQHMRDRIRASCLAILSEDRVGQLLSFYEDTINSFQPGQSERKKFSTSQV